MVRDIVASERATEYRSTEVLVHIPMGLWSGGVIESLQCSTVSTTRLKNRNCTKLKDIEMAIYSAVAP